MTSTINDMAPSEQGDFPLSRRVSPVLTLAAVVCLLSLALVVTIPQPIGPMLWDLYIYLDAANRIGSGQIPSVDFFAPVGALGYYLFAAAIAIFPKGQPLLLSAWSLLFVSAPLMALVLSDVQRRSVGIAFALLVPFLFYSLLPFNFGEFYPFPGSEGFGIYNRQVCQLLYVLASALVFVRDRRILCLSVALGMLALFLVKVTGAVAGAILCLMALGAGRLGWRVALAAGAIFLAVLVGVQMTTGLSLAYLRDISELVAVNNDTLLPRLLKAGSLNFGAFFSATILCALLVYGDRTRAKAAGSTPLARFGSLADRSYVWIAAFLLAGLLFESQNTGSQALIFLWPLLLSVLIERYRIAGQTLHTGLVALAILAVTLPPAVLVVQKAARASIGMVENMPLEHRNLKTMGAFAMRPFFDHRASEMRKAYILHRDAYAYLASIGEPPGFLLFSDYDFQWTWLKSADEAVSAILAYEAAHSVRFETMMTIDFVNPFPWLMDRTAPLHIAIGADPMRAVPDPDESVVEEVKAVDIALLPTCPLTPTHARLLALYGPELGGSHTRIQLTPCYDAFIRNDRVNRR